jgi:hypothetical protein
MAHPKLLRRSASSRNPTGPGGSVCKLRCADGEIIMAASGNDHRPPKDRR